jgi:hypothetical protein
MTSTYYFKKDSHLLLFFFDSAICFVYFKLCYLHNISHKRWQNYPHHDIFFFFLFISFIDSNINLMAHQNFVSYRIRRVRWKDNFTFTIIFIFIFSIVSIKTRNMGWKWMMREKTQKSVGWHDKVILMQWLHKACLQWENG